MWFLSRNPGIAQSSPALHQPSPSPATPPFFLFTSGSPADLPATYAPTSSTASMSVFINILLKGSISSLLGTLHSFPTSCPYADELQCTQHATPTCIIFSTVVLCGPLLFCTSSLPCWALQSSHHPLHLLPLVLLLCLGLQETEILTLPI